METQDAPNSPGWVERSEALLTFRKEDQPLPCDRQPGRSTMGQNGTGSHLDQVQVKQMVAALIMRLENGNHV